MPIAINMGIYLVACYFFLRTMEQFFAIKRSEKFIDREKNRFLERENEEPYKEENQKRLIFIIAVLEEESVVLATIRHFKKFLCMNVNAELVFVTTEAEENKDNNRTYQAILPHVSDQLRLLHYPHLSGNKADQINYVIDHYRHLQLDGEHTYYGIFDADSLPDIRGFNYLLSDQKNEILYQMFSIYSTNFNNLNLFNKAGAIYQTRWTLSHELPVILKNFKRKKPSYLSYTVGHGLFIRQDYMQKHPFRSGILAEDLLFGYMAVARGVYVKPIPFFDYCSSPHNWPISVRQSARWHAGDISALLTTLGYIIQNKRIRVLFVHLRRCFHTAQWAFGPVTLITNYGLCIFTPHIEGLFFLTSASLFYVFGLHMPIINRHFDSQAGSPMIYVTIFIKSLSNCAGPFYSYWARFVKIWDKNKSLAYKTLKRL